MYLRRIVIWSIFSIQVTIFLFYYAYSRRSLSLRGDKEFPEPDRGKKNVGHGKKKAAFIAKLSFEIRASDTFTEYEFISDRGNLYFLDKATSKHFYVPRCTFCGRNFNFCQDGIARFNNGSAVLSWTMRARELSNVVSNSSFFNCDQVGIEFSRLDKQLRMSHSNLEPYKGRRLAFTADFIQVFIPPTKGGGRHKQREKAALAAAVATAAATEAAAARTITPAYPFVRSTTTKKLYYQKFPDLWEIDTCTPCGTTSRVTFCPSQSMFEELRLIPVGSLSYASEAAMRVKKQHFTCDMYNFFPKRAAIYTPYHLSPGGGEKYLLETVSVFQKIGYTVDIISSQENVCYDKKSLSDVARQLSTSIDFTTVRFFLRQVFEELAVEIISAAEYDVFWLIGNEKIPRYPGLGKFNIFQCQFPFDLHANPAEGFERRYSSLIVAKLSLPLPFLPLSPLLPLLPLMPFCFCCTSRSLFLSLTSLALLSVSLFLHFAAWCTSRLSTACG